jgi:hypothetical protein
VTDIAREGRWLQLRLADARTGWITTRYVGRTIAGSPVPETSAERLVWTSPEGCQQVVGSSGHMVPANPAILRVGTWNIRWFPRGCPSNRTCPDKSTDIPWLACTMAWMNMDLFAIQEILATPDAEFSLNSLRSELNRLTGGSWQVDLQSCGGTSDQHVGFLWNGSRVALLRLTDAWELNGAATGPTGSACAGNLRPGRYALAETPIPYSAPSSWVLGISDIIKPHVRLAKEAEQVLMVLGEIENNRPLACLAQQVNANKIVQHPTCRWISNLFPFLVGEGRLMRFERLAYAIFQGCIHQQTYAHQHEQCHDAFRLFEIERRGQKARVFHQAKATFRLYLAFVTF